MAGEAGCPLVAPLVAPREGKYPLRSDAATSFLLELACNAAAKQGL